MNAKNFIQNLPPLCWSPRPPETYTIYRDGKTRGIGLIAGRCLASWNLLHDKCDWTTWSGHELGVMAWSLTSRALKVEVGGSPLSDTVLALGPARWPTWWATNRASVEPGPRTQIDQVTKAPSTA